MHDPLNSEIREQLARYVRGDISLHEFRRWFVPQVWNIHQRNDAALEDFVGEIDLRMAEYSNGDWSEEDLREILSSLLRTYVLEFGTDANGHDRILRLERIFGSGNRTVNIDFAPVVTDIPLNAFDEVETGVSEDNKVDNQDFVCV